MDDLPNELLSQIAEKVGLGEAVSLEGVSRRFCAIVCNFFWGNITALYLHLSERGETEGIYINIRLRPTGNIHGIGLSMVNFHHAASLLTKIAQSGKITLLVLCLLNVSGINNNQVLQTLAGLELTGIQRLKITMDGWGSDLDDRDFGPWLEQARLLSTNFLATNATTLKTFGLQLYFRWIEDQSQDQRQMKTMMREAFREPLRACTHLETLLFGDIVWPTLPHHNPLWSAVVEGGNSNLKALSLLNTPNNNPFLQREAEKLVDDAGSLEELSIRHYLLMASMDRVRHQYIHPNPFLKVIRLSVRSTNETRVQNGVSRRFPQLRQLEINDAESLPIHILEFLRLNANQKEAKDLKIACWDSSSFRDCHFQANDLEVDSIG